MTILDAVKEEAAKFGVELSDADAEWVLWEQTGYPSFWPISGLTPTPEACLRAQVREWAEKVSKAKK